MSAGVVAEWDSAEVRDGNIFVPFVLAIAFPAAFGCNSAGRTTLFRSGPTLSNLHVLPLGEISAGGTAMLMTHNSTSPCLLMSPAVLNRILNIKSRMAENFLQPGSPEGDAGQPTPSTFIESLSTRKNSGRDVLSRARFSSHGSAVSPKKKKKTFYHLEDVASLRQFLSGAKHRNAYLCFYFLQN